MFRLALIALAIYLFWALLRWVFKGSKGKTKAKKDDVLPAAEMVACARCGTFVVRSETVNHRGSEFCSESCAQGN